MKKILLTLIAALALSAFGCNSNNGSQQLETALFEEKQNNKEHAIKLYEEVIRKYPDSPNARTAREHLNSLKSGR